MNFRSYSKFNNHYNEPTLNRILNSGLDNDVWLALEKVHGSNVGIYTNGLDFKVASRKQFVEPHAFNSMDRILERYEQDFLAMYQILVINEYIKYGETVVFYGEVFGGSFGSEKHSNASNVQKGMDYHPDNEFLLFDVWVESRDDYLTWQEVRNVGQDADVQVLKTVPVLFEGTLTQALELPLVFQTAVPFVFGLTELIPCQAEGYVLRPLNAVRCEDGTRALLKMKNPKFLEKGTKPVRNVTDLVMKEADKQVFEHFACYLTENRVASVLSKESDKIEFKKTMQYAGLLMADAVEEFKVDGNTLDLENPKAFNKAAMNLAAEVVRKHLKTIL